MNLRSATVFGTTLLLVSACSNTPNPAEQMPPPSATPCNAAPAQFIVGRQADAPLVNDARVRAGARTVRVLKPGQVVTMEFNAERLSLSVDDAGRVTRVNCG
ncbi:I78 family peptidase inhibitor [Polaromonas aquatica]|uniref:I78 family peptidase inhibitor n=1 Tax=Polaromonas aquatica TaxID=332657 RepID=UPI003D645B32